MRYTKKHMMKDALVGGIIGGIAVYGLSLWGGYEAGEKINDFLNVTDTYSRYTVDYISAMAASSYGILAGPGIGGTIGAIVGSFVRGGVEGFEDLGDIVREMHDEF